MTHGAILADAVRVSILGGLLSLDRTAAFQSMVSRPMVTAPVIGLVMGNIACGLVAGITLELLLSGDLPVGGHVPLHETSIAAAVTAVAAIALEAAAPAGKAALAVAPALLLVLPAAVLYRYADKAARGFNERIALAADRAFERGRAPRLRARNLTGLAVFFLTASAALFATLLPMMYAAQAVAAGRMEPRWLHPALAGLVVLALASAVRAVETRGGLLIFSASGAAAAIGLMAVT